MKNILRIDTTFSGWRLSMSVFRHPIVCYFSDKKMGGSAESLELAIKTREKIFKIIDSSPRKNGRLTPETISKVEKAIETAKSHEYPS